MGSSDRGAVAAHQHAHAVQFYGADERVLTINLSRYIREGLARGESVLAITTPEHGWALRQQLRTDGVDPDRAIAEGRLVLADAAQTLSQFMTNGQPDPGRFHSAMAPLIPSTKNGARSCRVYGEMVGLLWQAGQIPAALELERLWNQFPGAGGFVLLCGYPIDVFSQQFRQDAIEPILRAHTQVLSAGSDGEIKLAVDRAMRQVLGTATAPMPAGPASAGLPSGEQAILGVRAHWSDRADQVLARARELYAGERRFRALIENSADAIALLDETGKIVYASPSTETVLGYEAGEFCGGDYLGFVHPDQRELTEQTWKAALASERGSLPLEVSMRRKDGGWCWVEGTLSNRIADPDIGAIVFNYRDVSARKQADEALRASERRLAGRERHLSAVLDAIPECVALLGPGGGIREMNGAGLAMIEAEGAEQALGRSIYPAIGEAYRPSFQALIESIFAGGSGGALEHALTGLKGAQRTCETRVVPLSDGNGRIMGALAAARDITERKQLEERLREAAKLESLGLLAGGVAHDFNNLLTGILGSASLLLDDVSKSSPLYPALETIVQASERASQLTRQMLAYSGRGQFVVEPLNLSDQVREILALLKASIPKHAHLIVQLEAAAAIEADAGQLQQLVMNLVINAAEAIVSEGVVSVETRLVRLERPRATITGELAAGEYVVLEVRDTGIGMDENTKRRIFDPFFTTKFTGRGLGLAAVLGIARGHKAGIEVESQPKCGSTFRVFFPVGNGNVDGGEDRERSAAAQGAGTILIVDDEDVVWRTAVLALERLGFRVLVATDGEAAVEQFRRRHAEISLVLLDMTMPGLGGDQTLKFLRAIDDSVPVLGSSGFSAEEAQRRFGAGIAGFLQKPYTLERLSEAVAASLRVRT